MPAKMLRSHSGHPDGFDVLLDMDRVLGLPEHEPLPLLLWSALRRVHAWAEALPEERAGLWGEGGWCREELAAVKASAPHLAAALDAFAELRKRPGEVDAAVVADGCEQVGWWGAEWGMMWAGAMFMEAAAAAHPEDAVRAMHAANLCQRLGGPELMQRAEQWHQRALDLARNAKKGRRLLGIRALLAYGNWARDAGDYGLAGKCYDKGARRAKRWERWLYFAMAHHNLLSLVVATHGELSSGRLHVQTALAHYPAEHPRLPMLLHDYAVLLNRHHAYGASLQVLEWLIPRILQSDFKLLALSSLSLAAAGAGKNEAFERAVEAALPLCSQCPDFAANALVHIAQGALLLGHLDRAQHFARRAAVLATDRADADAETEATKIIASCIGGVPSQAHAPTATDSADALAAQLLALISPHHPSVSAGELEEAAPSCQRTTGDRPIQPAPNWPLWGGAESISGLAVLEEADTVPTLPLGRSFSLLLWMAIRRVGTWARSTADQRANLITADDDASVREHLLYFRAQVPEIRDALGELAVLYHTPELLASGRLADAFDQVSRWAADHGHMRSAVLLMEGGATAEPENALRAMHAAAMCQRLGGSTLLKRAEEWHQRAFELARRAPAGRRLLTIRALLAYGNYALEVSEDSLARSCYERAARRAWRHARWPYFAMAHHNLLGIVVKTQGGLCDGETHALNALSHYPARHHRVPMLAHDFAALLNSHRLYSHAFRLLEMVTPQFKQPHLRLLALSSLAVAAAGSGNQVAYRRAVCEALPMCPLHPEFAANALVRLGEAAVLRRDFDQARDCIIAAQRLAEERGDTDVRDAAARIASLIHEHEPVAPVAELPAQSKAGALIRALHKRLQQFASI